MDSYLCDPPPAHDERLRAATAFAEISRAVALGHLTDEGLKDARDRLRVCNEWPDLEPDLDAMRVRLIDLTCRAIAKGDADLLRYYGDQGDLIDHVPDDLRSLTAGTPPAPPPPPGPMS